MVAVGLNEGRRWLDPNTFRGVLAKFRAELERRQLELKNGGLPDEINERLRAEIKHFEREIRKGGRLLYGR